MKPYLVSLALGLLVGIIYGVFNVRSPAPPVIALIGLLGILLGEQVPSLARHLFSRETASVSLVEQIRPHVFGHLPTHRKSAVATAEDSHAPAENS